jgi:hypothetical protein
MQDSLYKNYLQNLQGSVKTLASICLIYSTAYIALGLSKHPVNHSVTTSLQEGGQNINL